MTKIQKNRQTFPKLRKSMYFCRMEKLKTFISMLTQHDETQLSNKGISVSELNKQLDNFKNGFPFLRLESAATVGNGIIQLDEEDCRMYSGIWESYLNNGNKVVKFVPASGAASRMFKNLFAFIDAPYSQPTTDFEKDFFDGIGKFAFYTALNEQCKTNNGLTIDELIAKGEYKSVVRNLLQADGLNYGQLPKGLLDFHRYGDDVRTAMEEHLVEAALYAASDGLANVHFTVSHDHLELFKAKVEAKKTQYEERFSVEFNISFSEQKESTDTVAANPDNTPFRNDDGTLLFRPGGHGALIQNLNDIQTDVVFIKNIDNIIPDKLKPTTTKWKKAIAGVLVSLQNHTFYFIKRLTTSQPDRGELLEMLRFLETSLCCRNSSAASLNDEQLSAYLLSKFNRPMRVCGMVRNSGEPGGGPFFAYNADGTVSLQILESSQIDKANPDYVRMFNEGTHFNPVDLVCAINDYQHRPFQLPQFVDSSTGFISTKSKNGKELKALELPGLWNGAMSDWNTVFVEVPAITFNPVKTINDLLRKEHQ